MHQAEDRCHRIGQKSAVNVYYLLVNKSIVEKQILEILETKQPVLDQILNGEGRQNAAKSIFDILLERLANQPLPEKKAKRAS